MSSTVKNVLLYVIAGAVIMLGIAVAGVWTATAGVDPKALPPAYAETKVAVEGRKVFQTTGCSSCHQIMRQGGNGHDLTNIGDEYDREELARVIREPRRYLPGRTADLMPSFPKEQLSDKDLKALTKYLATLK